VSCSSSEALFEGYLDHTLLPAQRARLLAHLNGCGRCKGVLDELRVVDALLIAPRVVDLPENFTFATMAEVRSLPRPHVSTPPVFAYLVSYLVAAWLLIGAGFLLAGSAMRAFGETALDVSAQLARTFGAVGHIGVRIADHLGSLGTLLGAALALDVIFAGVLVVGFTLVRPRLAERLRP
jgi:anti-sigma factor RsiW